MPERLQYDGSNEGRFCVVLCVLCLCVWQPLVSDGAEGRVQQIVQLIQEVRTHLKQCRYLVPSLTPLCFNAYILGP